MNNNYLSEEEVKEALGIKDFRSLSKEKVMDFISIIPKVDKEVAISIINQFPKYTDMATAMVTGMIDLCNNALKDSNQGRKDVIETYKYVLETLRKQLEDGELNEEERRYITDNMIAIAEQIDNANDKHNEFIKDIVKTVGGTIGGVLIIGAAILGINFNKNK